MPPIGDPVMDGYVSLHVGTIVLFWFGFSYGRKAIWAARARLWCDPLTHAGALREGLLSLFLLGFGIAGALYSIHTFPEFLRLLIR